MCMYKCTVILPFSNIINFSLPYYAYKSFGALCIYTTYTIHPTFHTMLMA